MVDQQIDEPDAEVTVSRERLIESQQEAGPVKLRFRATGSVEVQISQVQDGSTVIKVYIEK